MTIKAITFSQNKTLPKKRINYVSTTGYVAAASAAMSFVYAKNKNIKLHKHLGYISGIFTALHIGIIEWYHHKKN